ncbi:MAG TPA: DUF2029 domain-containing protein [Thermoplasmata archaeon]|nr:DUF2029 domain-containing protein [Thermoplasmata archaeon]
MDYRVYKAGVQCLIHGYDPYPIANITQYSGDEVVYGYPPHTLLFYWFLQIFFILQIIWIYYVFLLAFLVASGYLLVTADKKPEYLFCSTLLATGFISMYWNFYNGNKDILYLFLFACIFYLLIKEKFWQSSIVLGLLGSFTLVPLPFVALSLAIKRPILKRIQYILVSIGVVAALFLIVWLINPALFASYIKTFQGSSSVLYEKSDILTPTPFLMLGVLLNQTNGISIPLILVSIVYICLIVGASWYAIRKNQENALKVYSLAMLAIFMILPRIKPYYFIFLAIPLYILFKDCSYKLKILVFVVISLLPLFAWYLSNFYRYYSRYYTGSVIYLISDYAQTFSLFLIFAITIALEYNTSKYSPSSDS